MMRQVFVLMMVCLVLTGTVSAATVSIDSYQKSCTQCSFDANGKMDPLCWQGIQDNAKTDLALAYPAMSFQYQFGGGCAPLDQCVSALQACRSMRTTGNDDLDCKGNTLTYCFTSADACAEAANQICAEGKSEEESGITDVLANMTTQKNDSGFPTEKTDFEKEKEVEDFLGMLCLEPAFIMGAVLVGALFCRRD